MNEPDDDLIEETLAERKVAAFGIEEVGRSRLQLVL